MEIVKLEFQGIGPFSDHHVIDFREIGQSGLFLLEGPTGSGKTTILDAIVFALYGDVAGADSSKGRIVSTMLAPGREPFVDLVIDSNRGLLRVRRTPEYERAKLRGEGTTTSKATVKLWKLSSPDDQEGAPISTNVAEASVELQQAVGLTKAQFTQTVILPQGDFATFLRAKPEDRRDVLQDIFGTELYDRFARKLADLASEHRAQLERARDGVTDAATDFCQVAWYDDAATADEPIPEQVAFDQARDALDLEALRAGSRYRLASLGGQVEQARRDAEASGTRHAEAAETLRALETRNGLIVELSKLHGSREELRRAASTVHRDEALLTSAEQAEHARRPIANIEKATAARDETRREMDAEVEQVRQGSDSNLLGGAFTPEVLRSHEDAARRTAALLDRIVEVENGLVERRAAGEEERQALRAERDRIDEARQQAGSFLDQSVALVEQLSARDEVAATLASAIELQRAADGRRDAARAVERLSLQLADARSAEQAAEAARQEAARVHEQARRAWLGSIAGELAAELVEGQPCAVCGSGTHPHPADMPAGAVRREEVAKLAEALQNASTRAVETRAHSDRIVGQLEEQVPLTNGLTVDEAGAQVASATLARDQAHQAAQDAATLRQRIDTLKQKAHDAERTLQRDAERLAARGAALETGAQQIVADQNEVAAQALGYACVLDRQQALNARANTARQLSTLLTRVSTAEDEWECRQSELAAVLAERDLTTAEEAKAAMLSEAERTKLRRAVTAHRDKVAGIEAQLADERFTGLVGATPVDPIPARDAEQWADAEQREAHRRSGAIETTVKAAAAASKDLEEKIGAFARLRDEAEPIVRMANLANAGDANLQRVTLPTYVLLRRFEEVVELANLRVEAMTGGRYELRRTDDKEGRSKKLGLGLEVVDHQAHDLARDPKTLSGGETFMASLSLALGLADAVMAEAGGIQLHTLFVDEGFGSLDSETLEAVMQQLSALRDGGRSVGVVSHVAEMKQRIAERITVVPRRDGTSTLTCSTSAHPVAV